ncbi:MAG TPA: FKBP-type peptidyl-prolyl cis-trans isomerase [Acidimicrobiales bacterium]|nr:FKBP-type peptidyl-prolyl cis-trans isomerase [Acidimicrobiales bacterium]
MGTEKRERQRTAREAKTTAQYTAAKRDKTKRTGIRVGIAAAVVLALAFGYSLLTRDDDSSDDDTATAAESTTTAADSSTTVPYSNPELAAEVLARQPPVPADAPADTPSDAVDVETLIEGEGEGAKAGDTVTVHYVGVLPDGTQFDESWSGGQTFEVAPLGQAQVIDGWNEGLVGAKIGERRRLVLGSDKAYGAAGSPDGAIPPDSPLVFEIDIVDIKPAAG